LKSGGLRYQALWVAILLFGLVPALWGQSPTGLQEQGIRAFQARQFAEAERLFSELVRQEPTAAAYNYLAAAEGGAGNYRQAIADFQKSIQLGNDTPDLRYDLALAYVKDRQFAPGIRQLNIALGRQPNFTQARYALGVALLMTNHPHEALANLQQVRSQLANYPGMWVNLAQAQFSTGGTTKALETVDSANQALPENLQLSIALATICMRYDQPQKARELLENATEAAPRNNHLKLLLAEASLKSEEPVEVLAVLKNVPETAGAPGQVAFLRGNALMLGGKLQKAAPLLASAITADPKNVEYLSTYAEFETSQKKYACALSTLRKAQQVQPRNPEFQYQTAVVNTLMHKYADAETACKQATRLDPKFDPAYFLLGAIELDRGSASVAEDAFRRAVAIRPAYPLYRSALGAALFKVGQPAESVKQLSRALLLDPHTTSAYYWRARVWAHQGDSEKAIQDLETFVALDPDYPDAYQRLARLYTGEGQTAKASAASAKYAAAKEKIPPEPVPFFLAQLGMARFRQLRNPTQ
ncbi:MAG: tetratricopeptide repeat protein, partial [Terriglobia bacterium]